MCSNASACTKCLQRDSRSIRDASPAVGAVKDEKLKGLPGAYGVFLFPGDRQHARRNSRPCRPQSRRLSELSVFASGVALFLLLPGHFVFPSSSSSLLLCSLFFSRAVARLSFTPFYSFIEQFYIEWLSTMLIFFSKRNI